MAMTRLKNMAVAFAILLTPCADGSSSDDYSESWPQWRGPQRDGSVSGAEWPDSLQGNHLVEQWRVELPPSYSGPVVSRDKVFVTYTRDAKYEGVRAFDRESGKVLWTTEWEGAMQVAAVGASMGSWIRSTPAWDGDAPVCPRKERGRRVPLDRRMTEHPGLPSSAHFPNTKANVERLPRLLK